MASPLANIIRRPPGTGWLILTGATAPEAQILRAQALVQRAGIILGLTPQARDRSAADLILEEWLLLSGWQGRMREFGLEGGTPPDVLVEDIEEASLILLPDSGDPAAFVQAIAATDLQEPILQAMDDGTVVVACGSMADALGEVLIHTNGLALPGLGWIPAAVIQTHFQSQTPCAILTKRPGLFRLGIPDDAALALGPEGERELWGEQKPTLTFGIGWDR